MSTRVVLLLGGLLALSGCATRTLSPDQAPEYTITRNFTPFYSKRPVEGATTDVSLSEKTRVKVLRRAMGYSLVQLEDSRTGYVANKNMAVAPPGSQERAFGSEAAESQPKPRKRRRTSRSTAPLPSPSPVLQTETPSPTPPRTAGPAAPTPTSTPQPPPEGAPAPTPAPTPQPAPLQKPKFRL